MVAICEMFFYSVHNWGEKTPKSAFSDTQDNKKWPVMKDSNLLIRDEGIQNYNTENVKANP